MPSVNKGLRSCLWCSLIKTFKDQRAELLDAKGITSLEAQKLEYQRAEAVKGAVEDKMSETQFLEVRNKQLCEQLKVQESEFESQKLAAVCSAQEVRTKKIISLESRNAQQYDQLQTIELQRAEADERDTIS